MFSDIWLMQLRHFPTLPSKHSRVIVAAGVSHFRAQGYGYHRGAECNKFLVELPSAHSASRKFFDNLIFLHSVFLHLRKLWLKNCNLVGYCVIGLIESLNYLGYHFVDFRH